MQRANPHTDLAATTFGSRFMAGLAAGFVGTVALNLFERVERGLLGGEPVYAPRRIVLGLESLRGRKRLSVAARRGEALRWTYGPLLGALLSGRYAKRSVGTAGLLVGFTIYGVELVAAPAVHATPRLRDWPRVELVSLLAHTSVFGIIAVAAYRAIALPTRRARAFPSANVTAPR